MATGLADGFERDEGLVVSGRQTIKMEERIRDENQTPMFLKGFGTSHAIFVQPEILFAVLIKSFNRPTTQVGLDNAFGRPITAVGDEHDIGAGQIRIGIADDQSDFAQTGNPHGQCEGLVGFVGNRDGLEGVARNE